MTEQAETREGQMVVVERDDSGKPTIWCDPEIAPLVIALNGAGFRTVASCSGHGKRPAIIALADGREIIIAKDFDEARKIDGLFPGINGEPAAAPQPAPTAAHPDDQAVDRFSAAMKAKLAVARAKGRSGWDDPAVCSVEYLAELLREHLNKGNAGTFEDVANFCMMLHQRGADPAVLAPTAAQDVAWLVKALEICLEMEERPKIIKMGRAAIAAYQKGDVK